MQIISTREELFFNNLNCISLEKEVIFIKNSSYKTHGIKVINCYVGIAVVNLIVIFQIVSGYVNTSNINSSKY